MLNYNTYDKNSIHISTFDSYTIKNKNERINTKEEENEPIISAKAMINARINKIKKLFDVLAIDIKEFENKTCNVKEKLENIK